jgi:hypothetical protein
MRLSPRFAACLLLALGGCARDADPGPAVDVSASAGRLFADPARRAVTVGPDAEGGPPEAVIGRVMAARLSGSGRHVVLLDVPPFVRVFDGAGKLRTAFLRRGGGPREARAPTALAVAGDSLILVGDGRRVSVFDLDGNLRDQLSGLPFSPISATAGCGGDWLLYGPRRAVGSRARSGEWLHRVRLGSAPRVESALPDSFPAAGLPFGLAFGLVRHGGGALLRHELGAAPVAVAWECGSARPTTRPLPALRDRTGSATPTGGEQAAAPGIGVGQEVQAGIAVLPQGTMLATQVVAGAGEPMRTRLRVTGRDGSWTATLPAPYVLRDSRPGVGVLVEADDPVPHLFVLRESHLVRVLGSNS